MSRYFNTDVFLNSVKQKAYPQSGSVNESERKISLFGIMEILTAMPTEDVSSVVHGEWIDDGLRSEAGNAKLYSCSNCSYRYVGFGKEFLYCPSCGARMDGGRDDKQRSD